MCLLYLPDIFREAAINAGLPISIGAHTVAQVRIFVNVLILHFLLGQ
jgi:hypothetical protein